MRLDFGALHNKYHGETERSLRQAIAVAEGMAPCVLWMDEIEKGLASSGGGESDGGVGRRVLGSLLTWMSERTKPVFVVATANDISQLPPELVRKGRFDEIFFVDFPGEAARRRIFEIHLRKRRLDPAAFDLAALAAHSEQFSGAEIEQAIVAASFETRARKAVLDTAAVTAAMPRLMDSFTTFLRETRPEELRGSAGIHRLREELIARSNILLRPGAVTDILFVELVVQ
jgi:SpoVK/Ycf46/Vps4 family AAA+-type ATPase